MDLQRRRWFAELMKAMTPAQHWAQAQKLAVQASDLYGMFSDTIANKTTGDVTASDWQSLNARINLARLHMDLAVHGWTGAAPLYEPRNYRGDDVDLHAGA